MCKRTIAEYEEELCPTKEEKGRQQHKHQVVLHRTDIHQLIEHQEECLPHLQGNNLTLEYPQPSHFKGDEVDPQPPYFKEEEEGECPIGQEEADLRKFPLTVVSVKTEEHEDKPPESSQLHHSPNVQQPPQVKEEEDDPQSPHIKEEDEDPQPPNIKEEEEEVWITQEGECLLGQEEADLSKFPLIVVSVKTEEHEDKPPESSQLHHSPNVQQVSAESHEEIPSKQQEWSSSVGQKELQAPSHIKEEEEELWKQLQRLEEANDEDKAHSLQNQTASLLHCQTWTT
ncbi:golgin subfamily A member 6-like protein 6 [Nerophis ophidion]|uniref:golgin subfamily A member 6-like protein 6 n=1 Tax=Nerophis ophidion TaxID=159077 RepID=UPI002ADFBF2D|nr:golgin subfamily A member 6-like protein 6 [Nerophis ophidion]